MRTAVADKALPPDPRSLATPSVVVATSEVGHRLPECLGDFPSGVEVIVVGEGARSLEETAGAYSHLRWRFLETGPIGTAEAFVLGATAARGSHVLMVRDDEGQCGLPARLPSGTVLVPGASETGTTHREVSEVSDALHAWSGVAVPAELFVQADAGLARALVPEEFWCRLLGRPGLRASGSGLTATKGIDGLDDEELWSRMAALEGVGADEGGPLCDALVRDLAGAINRHLRAEPERRERIVAEAERLGLRRVPWSVVNAGLARDLALSYCFPPDLDTSGLVAAKRLRARGLVTDVISHDLSMIRAVDTASLQLAGPALGRTRVLEGRPTFVGWRNVLKWCGACWDTLEQWEAEQGPYRSVYSRAMAPASHYAAALMKARRPQTHWVAEHSDPLAVDERGEPREWLVRDDWLSAELSTVMRSAGFAVEPRPRLFEWAEHLTYALADEIVFTNEHQRALMLGRCPDPALAERALSISRVDPHPVPPPALYEHSPVDIELRPGVVHVAYFGVFYGTRDLGEVFAALDRLTHAERDRLHLHVFTSKPQELRLATAAAGLSDLVSAYDYRPVLEFLNLTTRFDALLVNDARTADHHALNPYLPSKLADYRGSGTPIWAITETGSILSQQDVAHVSRLGDRDGTLAVLRQLIRAGGRSVGSDG